jgi:hypothetical protein
MYLRPQSGAGLPRLRFLVLLALASFPACARGEQAPAGLEEALEPLLAGSRGPIHYFYAPVDLDGQEPPELIVHVAGPMVCGTGGCNTMVFERGEHGLRLVTTISVTRPPIVVAETSTHGWRDLVVQVSGGGIVPGHAVRLRYDGSTYPANPTLESARLEGEVEGEVAIPHFDSFTEGKALRTENRAP